MIWFIILIILVVLITICFAITGDILGFLSLIGDIACGLFDGIADCLDD